MRGIERLHPTVREKAAALVDVCMNAYKLPVLITETWRTKDEQDNLFAQGRTATGKIVTNAQYPNSMHCWGLAFDFCRNVKGREYDDADNFFARVGEVGRNLDLYWGGNFTSIKDKPHFEDRAFGGNTDALIKKYGTPENFRAAWGGE